MAESRDHLPVVSSYKGISPIHEGPNSQRPPPQSTITLGIRFATYEFGEGDTNIQPVTGTVKTRQPQPAFCLPETLSITANSNVTITAFIEH